MMLRRRQQQLHVSVRALLLLLVLLWLLALLCVHKTHPLMPTAHRCHPLVHVLSFCWRLLQC